MTARLKYSAICVLSILMFFFASPESLARPPDYLAQLQLVTEPDGFLAGKVTRLAVRIMNRGELAWPSLAGDPFTPVRISYHWMDNAAKVVIHDGLRTELPRDLKPGESFVAGVSVLSPPTPGTYTLIIDLLREDVTWFAQQGSPPLRISPVDVQRSMGFTWQRGKILLIAGGAFALLFLMGLGAVRLFVPNLQGILSPLVGAGVVISLSYYASLLGISMRTATWGILAIGLAAALTAFLLGKPSQRSGRPMGLLPLLLTLVMLILALSPLWAFGRPSTVQNTYASYFVTMSEYWKAHSLREVPGLDPFQPLDYLVRERMLHGYVTGTPFLNAFIASAFNLNSYETYAILTALLLALAPATLHWVAGSALGVGPRASGVIACLAIFNVTYHLWSLRGQLPFVAGLLFLPLALGAGALLLEGRGNLFLAALSLSTLFSVYPPLIPYVLVPLLLYGVLRVWQKALPLRVLGLTLLKLFSILVLTNPVILYNMVVSAISAAGQVSENWRNIPGYPSIPELLGLLPHFSSEGGGLPVRLLTFGLIPAIVSVIVYGLYRAWKDGRWLLMCTVAPYALGAATIAFLMDYAYGYYKHGVVTLFAFLVAFVYGLRALWQDERVWRRLLAILCGGAFVLSSLVTARITFSREPPKFVSPELASLATVRKLLQGEEVVFIDEHDVGLQLWTSYFLWGTPLSIPPAFEPWGWWGFSSVSGRGDPLRFYHPQATYTLTRLDEITRPEAEPIWSNARYTVYSESPSLFLGRGWYGLEEGSAPVRWMAGEGTVRLRGDGRNGGPVRLKMVLRPIVAPLTLEVALGEERLGVFSARDASRPATFTTRPFSFQGEETITIRSVEGCFEAARFFGGQDHRCLSVAFQELALRYP
jgi:hypothetical protein